MVFPPHYYRSSIDINSVIREGHQAHSITMGEKEERRADSNNIEVYNTEFRRYCWVAKRSTISDWRESKMFSYKEDFILLKL
jgi:hypothetical protein